MLLTDKKNRNYAYVSMDDILNVETSNELEIREIKNLFNSLDFENDKIRISKNSRIYNILKNSKNTIDGDTYINPTMLAVAYARSSYEFNYEMKDRLFKYYKKYMDNLKENKSNEKLEQKILCDEKAMEYIHRFENHEDYVKHIIGTRINRKEELKTVQKEKNRSFVKMVA